MGARGGIWLGWPGTDCQLKRRLFRRPELPIPGIGFLGTSVVCFERYESRRSPSISLLELYESETADKKPYRSNYYRGGGLERKLLLVSFILPLGLRLLV